MATDAKNSISVYSSTIFAG